MRSLVIALCLLGLPCVSSAQSDKSSWTNLSGLQSGQKIQLVEMNSKKITGTFSSVTDTSISLQAKDGEQTIQRQDIRSVKLMKTEHRLRNAVIGGAVGAGVGAGIGAAAYQPCSPTETFCINPGGRGLPAAVGAVIGLVGGAALGALLPDHRTIYRAPQK